MGKLWTLFMKNLKDKSVIILAHVLTTVPAEDLKEYMNNNKVKRLLYIALPLFYKEGRPGPFYEEYQSGVFVKKSSLPNGKLPGVIQYIRDFLLTVFWIIKQKKRWDIIISLDNLNTASALFLRSLGLIDKVIYYTIDFTPKRFANRLMNTVYHVIEKYAVLHADITWILTERMAEGREKLFGISKKKQVVVPIGMWTKRIKILPYSKIEKHSIVYAGGLSPHQGIQLVLDAMPQVVKKIPDVKFKIIGIGLYEETLKKKTKELRLEKHVDFLGYQEKHENVETILSSCGLAVAMYSEDLDIWSYYADPSKIKSYMATGLPVITTMVTYIAEQLEEKKCGVIVSYAKDKLASAIIDMFSHPEKQKLYRKNALNFAKQFDWENVFSKGLSYV